MELPHNANALQESTSTTLSQNVQPVRFFKTPQLALQNMRGGRDNTFKGLISPRNLPAELATDLRVKHYALASKTRKSYQKTRPEKVAEVARDISASLAQEKNSSCAPSQNTHHGTVEVQLDPNDRKFLSRHREMLLEQKRERERDSKNSLELEGEVFEKA